MSKSQTGVWVIVFFIAIIFFILIKQQRKKMSRRGGVGAAVPVQTIFIRPSGDQSPIAVEVSTDAIGEDLIRQVRLQLNRPVNLLMHQGRPLVRGKPLSDQGIGSEAVVEETTTVEPIIIFNANRYFAELNRVWGVGTMEPMVEWFIKDVNSGTMEASLKIPEACLESPEVISSDMRPRDIRLKEDCDAQDIELSCSPSFDPNSISNIVFPRTGTLSSGTVFYNATSLS